MTTLHSNRRKTAAALWAAVGVGVMGLASYHYIDLQTSPRAPVATDRVVPAPERPEPPVPVARESRPVAALELDAAGTLSLRLDDTAVRTNDKATRASASSIPEDGVDAEAAGDFIESDAPAPLNLRMPAEAQAAVAASDTSADRAARTNPPEPDAVLDLVGGREDFDPNVESVNLFNPEYGLRGFMTQNWINQRVALQGGLGINDDRLIETEGGRRDDIAVGMGLIVAF